MLQKPNLLKCIHILFLFLGSLCIFSGFALSGYYAGQIQDNLYAIPLHIFLGVLGFYLALILHELGHAFFGRISGYKTVALGLGKWNLVYSQTGTHFKKKLLHKDVAAQYIGVKENRETGRDILMLSGGIIVHLTLIICYLILGSLNQSWTWFLPQICLNAGLFLLNLNPNGITDGAKIVELASYPEHKEYLYLELDHAAQVFLENQEVNLADFTKDSPLERGSIAQTAYLNHTEGLIVHGEIEEAQCRLETVVHFTENTVIRMLSRTLLLLAYLLQDKTQQARDLAQTKDLKKMFQQPQSQFQIIKAYYEISVLNDSKSAQKSLEKAKQSWQFSHFLKDEKDYYQKLFDTVKSQIQPGEKSEIKA
ncbi:M50 family metallopeptidase [Streptococcus himalayensis]|uniref:Peptidase M50 n=1 Tax=Streptococcus himalayensis TaxID=1888195 RepID=A0A917EEI6_9STRE|nr:M50 family metallopeptidase [Streptococcus himalayensis]GGE24146.1 peptidase M50 [Streptococcus himalayensis]